MFRCRPDSQQIETLAAHHMKNRRNYYRTLQVQPDAPAVVIKASYRALMQGAKMHPDLGGDHAQAAFLNEAFAVLSDPARRTQYDQILARNAPAQRQPTSAAGRTAPAVPGSGQSGCAFCAAPCNALEMERPEALCATCGGALFPAVKRLDGIEPGRAAVHIRMKMPMTFRRSTLLQELLTGTCMDVSLNGMQFLTATEIAIEERVSIDCQFCSAVAVVRNVRPDTSVPRRWRCGVEFLTLHLRHDRGGLYSTTA